NRTAAVPGAVRRGYGIPTPTSASPAAVATAPGPRPRRPVPGCREGEARDASRLRGREAGYRTPPRGPDPETGPARSAVPGPSAGDALAGRYRLPSERPRFGRGSEGDRLGCEQADRFVAQQAAAVATRPAPQHELSESREVGRGGKQPCVARYPTQLERAAVV